MVNSRLGYTKPVKMIIIVQKCIAMKNVSELVNRISSERGDHVVSLGTGTDQVSVAWLSQVESPELSIFITATRIAPPSPPTHPHTAGYARPVARTPIPVAFR
jgi:hypothetical protein